MELTSYNLPLYIIRDNPGIVQHDLLNELTKMQVQDEQDYWQKIDSAIAQTLFKLANTNSGSVQDNLNTGRPVFSYEWQLLRVKNPELADRLLDVFINSSPSWKFYYEDPDYDRRLEAYVEASIFSREAIGLPPIENIKVRNSRPGDKMYSNLPLANNLLPKLAPIMKDFLQDSGRALPGRVKLDFEMKAKFDTNKGLLVLGDSRSTLDDEKPVNPLKVKKRVRFAKDGTEVGSTLYLPLPVSAEKRFIYTLPHMSGLGENRPSIASRADSAIMDWKRRLSGYGSKISRLGGLALDREVEFSAFPVIGDSVEQFKGERYRRSATFPVTGRLILDVERMDVVHVMGSISGRSKKERMSNSAMLARVAGLELYSQDGRLIHRYDISKLTSLSDVAESKKAAQAEASAAENAALAAEAKARSAREAERKKQMEELTVRRESLRNSDVIGIRPGMTVREAENVIKAHMRIGWIGELNPDDFSVKYRAPDRPYNNFRVYVSADGDEHIALFWHPEFSDRLQAVTRTIVLPEKVSKEVALAQLKEKYGTKELLSSQTDSSWIWTVDYGNSQAGKDISDRQDANGFQSNDVCGSRIDTAFRIGSFKIIEGEPLTYEVKKRLPAAARTAEIDIRAGSSGRRNNAAWDTKTWEKCGPVISAEIKEFNDRNVLGVGMYDLSTYKPLFDRLMNKKKNDAEKAAGDLTL